MKRFNWIVFVVLVFLFIGCSSSPKNEMQQPVVPIEKREVIYSEIDYLTLRDYKTSGNIGKGFIVEAYVRPGMDIDLYSTYENGKYGGIHTIAYRGKSLERFENDQVAPMKKYRVYLEVRYSNVNNADFDVNKIEGLLTLSEANAWKESERLAREEEKAKPRLSPEGNEYVKKSLLQAVGDSKNPVNRGKILFFESYVTIKNSGLAGKYFVSEITSNDFVIMEYYGRIPIVLFGGHTILYRVDASLDKFTIDSFRE